MYEIEKGIPQPKRVRYPYREMKVGDSFLVSCGEDEKVRKRGCILSAASRYKPKKFTTQIGSLGVRCWRVK
jgi:hypothetical protein